MARRGVNRAHSLGGNGNRNASREHDQWSRRPWWRPHAGPAGFAGPEDPSTVVGWNCCAAAISTSDSMSEPELGRTVHVAHEVEVTRMANEARTRASLAEVHSGPPRGHHPPQRARAVARRCAGFLADEADRSSALRPLPGGRRCSGCDRACSSASRRGPERENRERAVHGVAG